MTTVERISADLLSLSTFKDPIFDENKIYKSFKELIENPKYKENMMKLKIQSMTAGGSKLACDTVEKAYILESPSKSLCAPKLT